LPRRRCKKKEYSLRGPLTTDKVIKLAHAIAVKNPNSDFKTYPSKTWLKNDIYCDEKLTKYTEGKKIVMKSETPKKSSLRILCRHIVTG
jgi:hypothetical protein